MGKFDIISPTSGGGPGLMIGFVVAAVVIAAVVYFVWYRRRRISK
jgi:hypothetical protein